MAQEITAPYEPQPKQLLLHQTTARQILYGGAAMGGKSVALRWDGIMFAVQNPGFQGYLFRRTYPELYDNHIKQIIQLPQALGSYSFERRCFEFVNGSKLFFCYCEQETDVFRHQGKEMHWLGIDEAVFFTESQLAFLKHRNRLGSWQPSEEGSRKRLPRVVFASNPGGPSHSYLKSTFIDPAPAETVFNDPIMVDPGVKDDPGWTTIYIPARMTDNRYTDPGYAASFAGMAPERAKALREGDWDAIVGQAIHNLSRDRHMVRQFEVPRHWTRFMSMDWGTFRPFSIGWYAVSDGATLEGNETWPERYLPPGAIVRYREWYGWNGRPNKGSRLEAPVVARKLIEMENGEVMAYRVADSEMWAERGRRSIIEWFGEVDPRLAFIKSKKDRKRGSSNCSPSSLYPGFPANLDKSSE